MSPPAGAGGYTFVIIGDLCYDTGGGIRFADEGDFLVDSTGGGHCLFGCLVPYCYWVVVAVTVWYIIVAAEEDIQRQYRSGR